MRKTAKGVKMWGGEFMDRARLCERASTPEVLGSMAKPMANSNIWPAVIRPSATACGTREGSAGG